MADLNDLSLVTQVAVFHNKRAFDQLVRKYQSPIRRFFLNQTLGDEQLSEAVRQMSVSGDSNVKMDVYAALALLKPDERTCITLQLIDGYPIDQISKITGIQENTVKSHLRRGKEKMADYLKQNGYG